MSRINSSVLWEYFEKVDLEDKRAKCNVCCELYSYKSSTGNLKSHLKKIHHDAYRHVVKVQEQQKQNYTSTSKSDDDSEDHQFNSSERSPTSPSPPPVPRPKPAKRRVKVEREHESFVSIKPHVEYHTDSQKSPSINDISELHVMDECDLYGQLLIKKLRKLNEQQRDLAMYEIDNIIYKVKTQKFESQQQNSANTSGCPNVSTVFVVSGDNQPQANSKPVEIIQQNPLVD